MTYYFSPSASACLAAARMAAMSTALDFSTTRTSSHLFNRDFGDGEPADPLAAVEALR